MKLGRLRSRSRPSGSISMSSSSSPSYPHSNLQFELVRSLVWSSRMAMTSGAASMTLTSANFKGADLRKAFLGVPVAVSGYSVKLGGAKPGSFRVQCERRILVKKPKEPKPKEEKFHIPVDQRWMFEEQEVDGVDIWNTTWYPKAADHVPTAKTWYVVDATDKILGRLASTIAIHIRGKNLATYTPSVDMGAHVIVVNAEKVAVSGKKRTQKLYRRHSGRPGGMTVETFDQLQQRIPERIIEHAVRGMLPKGRLGRALFTHLKVYTGPEHPHEAQMPLDLPIRDKRIQIER